MQDQVGGCQRLGVTARQRLVETPLFSQFTLLDPLVNFEEYIDGPSHDQSTDDVADAVDRDALTVGSTGW